MVKYSFFSIGKKDPAVANIQTAASALLVAIGIKYVNHVYAALLQQFNPGALPHLYILTTMANLAEVNGMSRIDTTLNTFNLKDQSRK